MSGSTDPHPLDDFEFGNATSIDDSRTRAHKPLLRLSAIIAAASFGLVFVFSVLASNSVFNSTAYQVYMALSNVSSVIMLVACCGMLIAYRLPHLDPAQFRSGAVVAGGWLSNRFVVLVGINLMAIFLMWACVYLISGLVGGFFTLVLGFGALCVGGLAATMAVVHKGYLRGYAVGMLAALILLLNGSMNMMFVIGPGFRGGVGGYSIVVAIMLTLTSMVGLLCGGYVLLIQQFTRDPL